MNESWSKDNMQLAAFGRMRWTKAQLGDQFSSRCYFSSCTTLTSKLMNFFFQRRNSAT